MNKQINLLDISKYFKTHECKTTSRHNWNICPYYHNESDQRRHHIDGKNMKFKYHSILPISDLSESPEEFSQNLLEYSYHLENYKKKKCIYESTDSKCVNGIYCSYVHIGEDIASFNAHRHELITKLEHLPTIISYTRSNNNIGVNKEHNIYVMSNPTKNPLSYNPEINLLMSKTRSIYEDEPPKYIIKDKGGKDIYIYSAQVDFFEDDEHEFKDYSISLSNLSLTIEKHIMPYFSAFLNTNGGVIYIGITDSGHINGIHANRHLRDKICCEIDRIVYIYIYIYRHVELPQW